MTRKALGKGIRAIIPEETQAALAEARPIRLGEIRPNPFQPRQRVDENLDELVQSVKEKGILQPVVVRRRRDGYELVMGERRFRAARLAGLDQIPAIVRSVEDGEMLEMALVENLQRRDLNAIEEALGYKRMTEEFGQTHEEVARRVGKDRSTVTNVLRLLSLPFKVRDAVAAGQISAGHARALLAVESRRLQVELCDRIIKEGLSVRSVERLCQPRVKPTHKGTPEKDPHIRALEESLQEYFGTKVRIREPKNGPGQVSVEYYSNDDLDRVVRRIRGEKTPDP
jgi:ParB family chromosome partitioning protein